MQLQLSSRASTRHARSCGSRCSTVRPAAGRVMGPEPPPARGKPDWVRILEEDAAVDEEVAQLLEGTGGDPDKIRAKMQQKLSTPISSSAERMFQGRTGSDIPPRIQFREVDVFDLWIWLELTVPPSERERELLQSCVRSWYVVGKLGGYNSQNLQVYYNNSDDNSFMEYDTSESGAAFSSYMHDCTDVEFKGSWARFHLDMGTADELAFDILINMLVGFSSEVAGIAQILVGGEHERWTVPANAEDDDDNQREHGEAPRVGMNPMKLPQGIEEELELLDEVGAIYDPSQQQQPGGALGFRGARSTGRQQGLRPVGSKPFQNVNGSNSVANSGRKSSSSSGSGSSGSSSSGSNGTNSSRTGTASRQAAAGIGRSRLQRFQQQQQQQPPPGMQGMTMYSPEEFKQAFNPRKDNDGDS